MCDPTGGVATMAIMAALSAMASMQQAAAAAKQAKHRQKVAEANQRIANQKADDALVRSVQDQRDIIQQGQREEQRFRVDASQALGSQMAAFAANGSLLDPDTSAGGTLIQTREQGELNAMTIRSNTQRAAFDRKTNGENEAWGLQAQAANFANEASAASAEAKNAITGGALSAGASLLGGASKVAGKWPTPSPAQPSFGAANWSSRMPGAAKSSS